MTEAERARMKAVARASEAFVMIELIERQRAHLATLLENHDARKAPNAKRDCAAFWGRMDELGLTETARRLAHRTP